MNYPNQGNELDYQPQYNPTIYGVDQLDHHEKGMEQYLQDLDKEEILTDLPENNSCQLRVSLTQLCNESCFFCHNEGNERQKVDFDEEIFKKIITTMKEHKIMQRVRFTGGEPLLYSGVEDLIKYVKGISPECSVGLTTNGLLLQKRAAGLIEAGLDKITISLHSLQEDRYKDITQVNGLQKVLKGLQELKKLQYKGKVSINSVIGTNNIDEVRDLDIFCTQYGYKLKLLDILPVTTELKKYALTQRQIEEITKINKAKGERTQLKCETCPKKGICGGEAEYLRVSPDGVLNPCLSLNKYDIDLSKIKNSDNFEKGVLLGIRRLVNLSL